MEAAQKELRRLRKALLPALCDHPEPNEYEGPQNPGDGCLGCVVRAALRLPPTWRRGMKLPPAVPVRRKSHD